MRKSQAPSSKTKLFSNNIDSKQNLNNFQTSTPANSGKPFEHVRSTENVLDLLLKSENIEKLDEEVIFKRNEIPRNEIKLNLKTDEINLKTSESPLEVFNVVYGKLTKRKHKTWEGDGTLEIKYSSLTLKDENGKIMGIAPYPKSRKLKEGERICIANKEVELIDVVKEKVCNVVKKHQNDNVLTTQTIIKTKLKSLSKGFVSPALGYSSSIALPEPHDQHQWHFNEKGLPITPVYIEGSLASKLREHQCAGIFFLYECIMGFKDKNLTGAILADEMGLGKTLQCIALIWTLMKNGPYGNQPVLKKVLIITPSSLTMNWHNEFIKWLGRVKLVPFVVNQKNKPCDMRGPVMIISYEMLVRCFEDVEKHNFDLLICDEGHRLKNTNIRTTQMLNRLNCSRRILLTGTPIQNDLQEFYALVDFVNPNVLGTPSEFRRQYEEPILASRQPNVNEEVLARGRERAQDLKRITTKFLLRRSRDILNNYLPPRHEVIVFCRITEIQRKIYNSLIDSTVGVKENILGLSDGFAHLELITTLRKICSHPSLLPKEYLKQNFQGLTFDLIEVPSTEISSKVIVTVNFLRELRETSPKEKVVLVSNSTQTLDLLKKILDALGYTSCRLDGSTPTGRRNEIVERFNLSYCDSFVFLLSAKAGGIGLNLTGASRLILFDSDWNPAVDLQAIARIWRDGQKYSVFIYRLLTTGTIEEKIYQRQISKQGLCEGTVDPENAKSIKLSSEELRDIFTPCSVKKDCLTHEALFCSCSKNGEIPAMEVDEEEESCKLLKKTKSSVKISELFQWEHHGSPFDLEFLSKLCLKNCEKEISFIFHCCKI